MSDADSALSEDERALLDASTVEQDSQDVQEQLDQLWTAFERKIDELRDELEERDRRIRKLEVSRDHLWETVNKLERQAGLADLSHETLIGRYTHLVEDGHEDAVEGGSLRRAVEIHRNWDEWSYSLGANHREHGISTRPKSTRKYSPSKIRVQLEDALGESLESTQVHRAMETLAEKSVAEPDSAEVRVDDGDRKHVIGDQYEYHQRTSPDNTDGSTYHVVVER